MSNSITINNQEYNFIASLNEKPVGFQNQFVNRNNNDNRRLKNTPNNGGNNMIVPPSPTFTLLDKLFPKLANKRANNQKVGKEEASSLKNLVKKTNLLQLIGLSHEHQLSNKNNYWNPNFEINSYLNLLENYSEDILFDCQLQVKLVTDSTQYQFIGFTNELNTIRDLIFPNVVTYKISIYKHNLRDEYLLFWELGWKNINTILIENETSIEVIKTLEKAYNRIYFGCPGTGKSTTVEGEIKDNYQETVTFHPEFDYASFIGCYKPFTEVKGEEKIISYQFVAQAFIKLYVEAWKNLDKAYYFVIEEINRGNCAAIFGDIFQLLDRDLQGYSRYFISIDSDLANYLENELKDNSGYLSIINSLYLQKRKTECKKPYQIMLLPNNLSILATMNTSDQSLFPMDSAFKRRWEWKYIAIDYEKAKKFQLKIADNSYNWGDFLLSINKQIFEITESEDKQMGTFFVVPDETTISEDVFLNKVLFYLWYDVLKNEGKETIAKVFPNIENEGFHYAAFFTLSEEEKQNWLKAFFELHNIPVISNVSEQNENPN